MGEAAETTRAKTETRMQLRKKSGKVSAGSANERGKGWCGEEDAGLTVAAGIGERRRRQWRTTTSKIGGLAASQGQGLGAKGSGRRGHYMDAIKGNKLPENRSD